LESLNKGVLLRRVVQLGSIQVVVIILIIKFTINSYMNFEALYQDARMKQIAQQQKE